MIRRTLLLAALLALTTAAPRVRAESVHDGGSSGKPGSAPIPPVPSGVRSVLQDSRYRFCHEENYPLNHEEHAWCPLVGTKNGACPSLPAACKLPPVERRPRLGWGGGDPAPEHAPDADTRRRPFSFSLPDMSGFAMVLFFVLLAVFVILVARAIAKNLLRDGDADESAEPAPPADAPPGAGAPPPLRSPVETDVERLIARARAAAARGDYGGAVDDAYAALLRRLDGDGLIAIHPSRTNGDYVRSLRERPDLQAPVRAIARDVEQVQFGATAPSETVFREVLERVLPLVGRALGLVLVSFGLSIALSCTPHDGEGYEGRGDHSPSGTQAVIEVLSKHGLKIRRRTEPLSKLDHPHTLVLLSDAHLDDAAWKQLIAWVTDKGGQLVVAGVTSLPDEIEERVVHDEVEDLTLAPDADFGQLDLGLPPGRRVGLRAAPGHGAEPGSAGRSPIVDPGDEGAPLAPYALGSPTEGVLLRRGGSVVATERSLGEGRIIVFADDRLFSNIAMTVRENAAFVEAALSRWSGSSDQEIEICDAWTGAGAQTPLESLQQARLTPVIVQLFVALALLLLWKGRAFSRLRDPPSQARRAFADHARALGSAYARSRASRHVAGLYAVWALERLRERVHRSGRQGLIPLAEAIAQRTGRPEGEVMSVLVDATGARDEAAPPSSFRAAPTAPAPRNAKGAVESDLELMRALMSFLSATGSKSRSTSPPTHPASPSPSVSTPPNSRAR